MEETFRGTVVHRRKCSKTFFLFELRLTDRKLPVFYENDKDATELWRSFRLGDSLAVTGRFQEDSILATSFIVEEKWSGENPFVPEVPTPCNSVATNVEREPLPCKYWLNTGRCQRGDQCPFSHQVGIDLKLARKEALEKKRHIRRECATQNNLSLLQEIATWDPENLPTGILPRPRSHRAALFADWIVKTYGRDYLTNGTGVIDVAGGRGEVSMELVGRHGIPCTIWDPRDAGADRTWKPTSHQWKWLKKMSSPKSEIPVDQTIKSKKDDELLEQKPPPLGPKPEMPVDRTSKSTDEELLEQIPPPRRLKELFTLETAALHSDTLKNCSLLIGMHPDQATEPILDYALNTGKNFAIVPCCLFSRDHGTRNLDSGREVVNYEDFVEYLHEKASPEGVPCLITRLPFEGRNYLLYRRAKISVPPTER